MTEFKEELKKDVLDENGLTHKENRFLDLLFSECGGNIKRAMELAGLSGPQNILIKKLGPHIKTLSHEFLAANTAKASINLVEGLNDPNLPGTKNMISIAKEILDRSGVVKEEKTTVQEQNFLFILPPKDSKDDDD